MDTKDREKIAAGTEKLTSALRMLEEVLESENTVSGDFFCSAIDEEMAREAREHLENAIESAIDAIETRASWENLL